MTKIPRLRLFNSVVKDKMPNPETSKIGEIYINANAERPFLSTKTSDGEMVKVIAEDEINAKIQAEATARQEADNAIKDSIKNIDTSNKADVSALTQEISDRKQEDARIEGKITDETTAREYAINDLTTSINDLKENGGKVQDVKVNGVSVVANKVANIDLSSKADTTALTEVSTAIESKADNAALTQVSKAVEAKADVSALTQEVTDRKSEITRVEGLIPTIKVDDVQVDGVSVVANKVANIDLSSKADTTALTQVSKAVETKADTTALTQVSAALTQEVIDRKSEITRVEGLIPTIKVDDVQVDGVSVVTNKIANIELISKYSTVDQYLEVKQENMNLRSDVDQINSTITNDLARKDEITDLRDKKADKTDLDSKADSTALTQVSTALTQEISDRKSEITRVEGLIQGGGGSSSGGISEEQLTDDEQTIAAAFQEQKINIDALRLSIETLKKRISSLEKTLKANP